MGAPAFLYPIDKSIENLIPRWQEKLLEKLNEGGTAFE
jgi:hypothetical protein